ncbi:MAG: Flp pilus assembly protein CpaB [Phycisphaerales bacterium]
MIAMGNNRLMMIVAVIAGLLSTGLAFLYLQQTSLSIRNQQSEPLARIVVAMRDLPANTPLNVEEDLTVKVVPANTFEHLVKTSVKDSEMNSLEGVSLKYPVAASLPIQYSHMAEVLDLAVAPGARAMTIDVSDAGGLGGLLVPGDRVDVVVARRVQREASQDSFSGGTPNYDPNNPNASINAVLGQVLSQSMQAAQGGDFVADVVVSNVRVLAVGTNLALSRQQFRFGTSDQQFGQPQDSTVTLELTTEQALALVSSTGGGSNPVTLLLRPKEAGENPTGLSSLNR